MPPPLFLSFSHLFTFDYPAIPNIATKTGEIFGVYRIFRHSLNAWNVSVRLVAGCRQDGVRRPSLDENMAGAAPVGFGAVDLSDPDGKRHMEAMRILNTPW
jgi:hypothetical protein